MNEMSTTEVVYDDAIVWVDLFPNGDIDKKNTKRLLNFGDVLTLKSQNISLSMVLCIKFLLINRSFLISVLRFLYGYATNFPEKGHFKDEQFLSTGPWLASVSMFENYTTGWSALWPVFIAYLMHFAYSC